MRDWKPNKWKEWDPVKSESLDLLACEKMILRYMEILNEDKTSPITQQNLFDFWKYIQNQKDKLSKDEKIKFL